MTQGTESELLIAQSGGYQFFAEKAPSDFDPVGEVVSAPNVDGFLAEGVRLHLRRSLPVGTKLYTAEQFIKMRQRENQDDLDLLKMCLAAMQAEMNPDWQCNSYHPKMNAALAALSERFGQSRSAKPDADIEMIVRRGERVHE